MLRRYCAGGRGRTSHAALAAARRAHVAAVQSLAMDTTRSSLSTRCGSLALCAAVLAGCSRGAARSDVEASAQGRSSGAEGGCETWGGAGFSLVVRAQSSHALFFREFAYDDRTGVLRVHDSDLFAEGRETQQPRVIQRSVTPSPSVREALSQALVALCPDERELASPEAPGGGTVLTITTAAGARSTVRYASGSPADVARRTHARFVQYCSELRRQ